MRSSTAWSCRAPEIDFSDRDYFKAHVAGDIGTHIGEALKPRPPYQGAAFFGVSRRRPNEDGSFAGVIQASVLPEYFENFYARIGREPGSFFALGLTDGAVLARFPAVDRELRLDRNGPVGQKIAANPKAGLITMISPADGIERRLGYQRLAEYPIYISAGLETSAIRARWLSTMSQHLIFGAPATALLFFLLGAGAAADAAPLFRGRQAAGGRGSAEAWPAARGARATHRRRRARFQQSAHGDPRLRRSVAAAGSAGAAAAALHRRDLGHGRRAPPG